MERRPTFAWQSHVPQKLVEAVRHLREQYDKASWNIDQVTRHLCYAALHPGEEVKYLKEHQAAFEQLKPLAGPAVIANFTDKMNRATAPAYFSAFYVTRKYVLNQQVAYVFQELLSMADIQRQLIPDSPPAWASAQVQSLIDEEVWRTPHWLKKVCDVQPYDPKDEDMDEAIQWLSWRAPLLLVMEPSRQAPYDSEATWQRQDQNTTLRWLDRFAGDVLLSLENVVKDAVGEAHLAMLKREPLAQDASPTAPPKNGGAAPILGEFSDERNDDFGFTEDYRSVQFRGETYSLTSRQATLVKLLHKAALSSYPSVSKDRLLSAVESETSEVRNIFRNCPLWGTLIVKGDRRDVYRLNLPKTAAGQRVH